MITIIGSYPNRKNERDGMLQRIAAIDNLFKEIDRRYLEISLRKNLHSVHIIENEVDIYRLNAFVHFFLIVRLLKVSDYIYVHSIYNSLRIFMFYFFFKNIITDLHGVVPAELLMYGRKKEARLYNWIEKIVTRYSYKLIVVTECMEDYYTKKYSLDANKFLFISIFTNRIFSKSKIRKRNGVIYSGGTQKWQCIDKMIELIEETKDKYEWTVLTANPSYFSNINGEKVLIKSVKPEEVECYYSKNTFGIILRENSIVNKVACPTKLIEYIQAGLVPVVLSPYIGDFYKYGFQYVIYEDFKKNNLPSAEEVENICIHNYKILKSIMTKTRYNIEQLKEILSC